MIDVPATDAVPRGAGVENQATVPMAATLEHGTLGISIDRWQGAVETRSWTETLQYKATAAHHFSGLPPGAICELSISGTRVMIDAATDGGEISMERSEPRGTQTFSFRVALADWK